MKAEGFVTTIKAERHGNHVAVSVWVNTALAGTLVVRLDEAEEIIRRLKDEKTFMDVQATLMMEDENLVDTQRIRF